MTSEYDDDNEYDEYENNSSYKSKNKKYKNNPAGPYKLKMVFRGIEMDISIKNKSLHEFEVSIETDKELSTQQFETIKNYLEVEGFEEEAAKHNLLW